MDESTSSMKIIIGILVIVVILALIATIIYFVQKQSNASMKKLEGSTAVMGNSTMTLYDNELVSGTTVASAFNALGQQDYIILVETITQDGSRHLQNYGALCAAATGITNTTTKATESIATIDEKYTTGSKFLGSTGLTAEAEGQVRMDNDLYKTMAQFETTSKYYNDTGMYLRYDNTGTLKKSGHKCYVRDTATFHSFLIYNGNNEVVGVAFAQVN